MPCKMGFLLWSEDFLFRGLSLHGFWLINWIRNAPRTEIQEIYQKLGDLVADGSLSATVAACVPARAVQGSDRAISEIESERKNPVQVLINE